MHCFQTRCILLVFSFYHFLAYEFILRTTVSCCSENEQSPRCLGFICLFISQWEPLDPRMGLVQPSCSVMSDSLQPRGLQHARLPCPSPTPELAQTLVHQVSDAIQASHPLSSPFPPAFSLSQHQGLFE